MNIKVILFLIILIFMGTTWGCSGWITNNTTNEVYYNLYNEDGTLNNTYYMDRPQNNTNTSQSNTSKNKTLYLDDIKTQ